MIGRRSLLRATALLPLLGCVAPPTPAAPRAPARPPGARLKVVAIGGHPDDPESGCGGTLARYAEAGHDVVLLYVTAGELGIQGTAPEETAKIRTQEAKDACAILGAKALFLGQKNGQTEVTNAATDAMRALLAQEKPDVLFTHWPLDTDWDHQVASMLTTRAYLTMPHTFPLYFYEVESGAQTIGFSPTAYVDISGTREKKIAALRAHKSQSFDNMYERHHEKMEAFRGRELGAFAAEAFVVLGPDAKNGMLPGLP